MFFTDSGIAVPSVTREQMIEIDRLAIEETGPNLFQMMENAGRNLAEFCLDYLGKKWLSKNIFVLAGKGNNGGGSICAARHLINHGGKIKLILSDPNNLNETANYQRRVYSNSGGEFSNFEKTLKVEPDLIIDALIGYNLKDEPTGNIKEMIDWANSFNTKIISLDIPSGINSNNGETPGVFIKADITITLALPKAGLGKGNAGKVYLADIGIPKITFEKAGINYIQPFNNNYIVPLTIL